MRRHVNTSPGGRGPKRIGPGILTTAGLLGIWILAVASGPLHAQGVSPNAPRVESEQPVVTIEPATGTLPGDVSTSGGLRQETGPTERIAPPLGLGDAERLLAFADGVLKDASTTPTVTASQPDAQRAIELVGAYMERVARTAVANVSSYKWISIGRKSVGGRSASGVREDSDIFRVRSVGRPAMAVRFRATREDVYLVSMVVTDDKGGHMTVPLEQWCRSDLPKRTVFYLERPTRVASITLTSRREGARLPRVTVEIGVTDSPDYAREIRGLCRQAQDFLHRRDIEKTREAIATARSRLTDFRKSRNEATVPSPTPSTSR
jgi:hypothetical protein